MKTQWIFAAAILIAISAVGQEDEEWIHSPEALFATRAERSEWDSLLTRADKETFRNRYWLKRDPTPGTTRNEFREMILSRIATADARFAIEKTPGSRTARGHLFIVLGTPAVARDLRSTPPPQSTAPVAGRSPTAAGMVEGNETTSVWVWDRQRTPKLLEALDRPSLEMTVVVEPSRRRDRLQNPALFNGIREKLAEKSIVNAELVAAAPEAAPAPPPLDAITAQIPPRIHESLNSAPGASWTVEGHAAGSALVWRESEPVVVLWSYLDRDPATARNLTMYGVVSDSTGKEAARFSKAVRNESGFLTSTAGAVTAARLKLSPGNYTARIGVFDSSGTQVMSSRNTFVVPAPDAFGVSNLILSGGANPATPGGGEFVLDGAQILPRADAKFLQTESLWYFFTVINPPDPNAITAEVRLRRGTEWIGSPRKLQVTLDEIAPGRYLTGYEMPLATLDPGDYSLYVTVSDGTNQILRRGDFRVLAR